MSKREITVCDACGDYGRHMDVVPVTVGDKMYDACGPCSTSIVDYLSRGTSPDASGPAPISPLMKQGFYPPVPIK